MLYAGKRLKKEPACRQARKKHSKKTKESMDWKKESMEKLKPGKE